MKLSSFWIYCINIRTSSDEGLYRETTLQGMDHCVPAQATHHTHIGSAADSALLDDIRHLVDDVHERDWAGSDAARRADHRSGRSQELVSHAGSAARLMNRRRSLRVLHDSRNRVGH